MIKSFIKLKEKNLVNGCTLRSFGLSFSINSGAKTISKMSLDYGSGLSVFIPGF